MTPDIISAYQHISYMRVRYGIRDYFFYTNILGFQWPINGHIRRRFIVNVEEDYRYASIWFTHDEISAPGVITVVHILHATLFFKRAQ
jgi:hypothetical protein